MSEEMNIKVADNLLPYILPDCKHLRIPSFLRLDIKTNLTDRFILSVLYDIYCYDKKRLALADYYQPFSMTRKSLKEKLLKDYNTEISEATIQRSLSKLKKLGYIDFADNGRMEHAANGAVINLPAEYTLMLPAYVATLIEQDNAKQAENKHIKDLLDQAGRQNYLDCQEAQEKKTEQEITAKQRRWNAIANAVVAVNKLTNPADVKAIVDKLYSIEQAKGEKASDFAIKNVVVAYGTELLEISASKIKGEMFGKG